MTATLQAVKNKTFDYVIVGGGAAGLALAARLSEDNDKTVCVLEAGGANLNDVALLRPGGYATHFGNKAYDWDHKTTKQKLIKDRVCDFHRGSGLGGSSAINFMVYTKPPAEEIDDFERLGNPGWNWKNIGKYMAKSERYEDPLPEIMAGLNSPNVSGIGRDGPLAITYPPMISGLEVLTCEAYLNAGLPAAPKPYDGQVNGVYLAPNTRDPVNQTRSYSTTAYFLPNKDRPNLTVLVHARALRVASQDVDGKLTATGVEFAYDGQTHVVRAKKEVILSAGALRSPQLLELSGIGRRDVLDKIGVPVKVDLPGVGENMQEHIVDFVTFELNDKQNFNTFDALRDPVELAKQLELYTKHGEGIFTMGINTFAFLPLASISPNAQAMYEATRDNVAKMDPETLPPGLREQYDILLHRLDPGNNSGPGCEFIMATGTMHSQPNPPVPGKKYMTFPWSSNHPFSRGTIHAVSKDPMQEPEIDAHYFEHDIDMQIVVEMVKFARRIAATSPLKELITKELNPGPDVQTDEEIRDWIGQTFTSTWHTASTCSMLPRDKNGVVDHNLKVYGTNNLRVVDLSIVPLHFASHTQSLVYGVAEQAADIVKGKFQP